MSEECKRIVKFRLDTEEIEQKDCIQMKPVRNIQNRDKIFTERQEKKIENKPLLCMSSYKPQEKLSI